MATEVLRLGVVAFRFLTRLPLPEVAFADGDLRRAAAAFPLVGVVVGAIGVAVRAGAEPLWGPVPATIAAVGAMVAVTGALHEDGLADSADGLWGGWDRDQRLAIMRDSRIGTYGVVVLVGALALRVSLLAALPFATFAAATVSGAVLGRASMLLLARSLPAAAAGSGSTAVGRLSPAGSGLALATVGAVLVLSGSAWIALVLPVGAAVVLVCRRILRRRLGGLTGDGLGATNQLVELSCIATVAALAGAGLW